MSRRALGVAVFVAALSVATAKGFAEPFRLRAGMGGLADPGAATCGYLNGLYEGGPTGFRQMLLYWSEGYLYGRTGKTLDQLLATAPGAWTFDSLTGRLVAFCAANPEAGVPAAAEDLARALQAVP